MAAAPRRVTVLSRQRVVGSTNGSSVYLLSLCRAIRAAGMELHLVCPSPAVFGRWPALHLAPEMDVFASIAIRGGVRVGRFIVASDPRVALRAAATVLDRLLARLGLGGGNRVKPAPYAIGVPWLPADHAFITRRTGGRADAVVADYAFLTDGIAGALRPGGPSLVVMHDLFSSRAAQFDQLGGADSVATLTLSAELAMLAKAGAVLAIQAEEGAVVQRGLPGHRVIVGPMAIDPVAAPQPGTGQGVLFVGSNAAPNVDGLRWFLQEAWPAVLDAVPGATLTVAGAVKDAFPTAPAGVTFLGRVGDLAPLYAAAAAVVSPLRAGSGLKIKLVEALGHGKAVVATPVTLQGVEHLVAGAALVEQSAAEFAAAVVHLLQDPAARAALAATALDAARRHFSAEACYRDAVEYLGTDPTP